ncbi:MAG: helix-turn-helix domain-containing protein [Parasporobacterium sp.]|nr:helix-turn-helix domain-containing protein [Parasporobacterium sp.]
MVSSQLLQKTLDDIKNITGKNMAILDLDGRFAARTDENFHVDADQVAAFAVTAIEQTKDKNNTYFKVRDEGQDVYVLVVSGNGESDSLVGVMARYQVEIILAAYKEKFDKDNFFKSLLLDNLMLLDIFDRAKRLHIEIEQQRVVYIIRLQKKNQDDAIEIVRSLFINDKDTLCTPLSKNDIVVIKAVGEKEDANALEAVARNIYKVLKNDIKDDPYISYGTVIKDLKDVSKSYREASMTMEVSRIFSGDSHINSYANLGIGRLIYQLPIPLCNMYLREILGEFSIDDFDEETLVTINKFFENSLNVSETSRQLYIHRNTLVYRLDKIQKITGLDLRIFDDAVTFKIALMVSRYMKYVETQEKNKIGGK